MIDNLIKAAILNKQIYPEFKSRPELVIQSLGTVAITGFSSAIYLYYKGNAINPESEFARLQMMTVAFSTIFVGMMMWSFINNTLCGLMGGDAEFRDTIRSTGIAYGPGVGLILATIPIVGDYILLITLVWLLVAVTIGVKTTHNITLLKAFFPSAIGWFMAWILLPWLMIIGPYFTNPMLD
ncbi:MAG: YIP1 family protein [SAR202 cluster bacterium]|nr:YIP1 family protein [SAR202 cluster bacterium]